MAFADHGISFLVTSAAVSIDDGPMFIDRDLIGMMPRRSQEPYH